MAKLHSPFRGGGGDATLVSGSSQKSTQAECGPPPTSAPDDLLSQHSGCLDRFPCLPRTSHSRPVICRSEGKGRAQSAVRRGGAQPRVAAAAAPFRAAAAATFPAPSEQRGFTRRGCVGSQLRAPTGCDRQRQNECRFGKAGGLYLHPPLVFNFHFAMTLESTSAGGGLKLSERPTVGREMRPRYTSGSLDFWIQLANKNDDDRKKAPHSFCESSGNFFFKLGNVHGT